ncbi:MAG: twin-arginine translocation signal domain-containing protein, partial [Saprospiraceae bacterium]
MEKKSQPVTSYEPGSRGISRREFVGKTALMGAGLAVGPTLLAACSGQPNKNNKMLLKVENNMNTRKLGKLEVSEIGLGCMNMAGNYNPPADHQQSVS